MNIDLILNKLDKDITACNDIMATLDKTKDAEYWLQLGKADALSECTVLIITEYSKTNKLSEYHAKLLRINEV